VRIRQFKTEDSKPAAEIWNSIVEDGIAFPQMETLSTEEARNFFESQSYTGIAEDNGDIIGLYILHPNNVGRCGHICNTSYAVKKGIRGKHIGEQLVKDSMAVGKRLGFRILQFNAVVATNEIALHLYKKLGFTQLGRIPGGFLMKDGHYEDIIPHYIEL
jgi:L-amino acid N-acyltransferase YncA